MEALFFLFWGSMKFGGFQKLSLLNYPDKMACAVFTNGCNFRCPYCHNAELVCGESRQIDPEQVLVYLNKRKGILDGICISGGEPLMTDEILTFMETVKKLGYLIKLDTNGSYPDRLKTVITKGLADHVAMDVKNTPARYAETIGLTEAPLTQVRESISFLKEGRIPYEFRTTVVREFHSAEDIREIAAELSGAAVWYLQPFRDAPEVPRKGLHAPDQMTMGEYGSIGNRFIKTIIRN